MSEKENDMHDSKPSSIELTREADGDDLLGSTKQLVSQKIPPGVDRRKFLMRTAVGGAAAIMTGKSLLAADRTSEAIKSMPVIRPLRPPPRRSAPKPIARILLWSEPVIICS